MHDPSSPSGVPGPEDADVVASFDTTSPEYTRRLAELQGARWKRVLHVQAPYRWNILRHLRGRPTLDVGAGIGRTLGVLPAGSVGVDHNPESVAFMRARGLDAVLPADLFARSRTGALPPFQGLLAAHLLEHLEPGSQEDLLRPYLELLAPGGVVVLVCPQERGYASDPTHTEYVDDSRLETLCRSLGLAVRRSYSFPFPRWAGRLFVYNEFCVVARKAD